MSKIEKAVQQMIDWANDSSHGYDQIFRWGEKGDFDCSSSIIEALERAGIPAKTNGATYTGNMYLVLIKLGFVDVTDKVILLDGTGTMKGDILLNKADHVAMCIGNGKLVQASINEMGTTTGGQPGDQTGTEFYIRDYYNYPWDCVLRYIETEIGPNTDVKTVPTSGGTKDKPVPHSSLEIECAGRIKKDTICRTGIGQDQHQAILFPELKKGALVDIAKTERLIDKNGERWAFVRVAHPTEGFVCEYIPYVNVGRFSTKSS